MGNILKRLKSLEAGGMIFQSEIGQLQHGAYAAETELKLTALELDIHEKIG